jgi:3-oxoacyl-[acyl-carrier protein] reductase
MAEHDWGNNGQLNGQVAIVTGGTSGIGRACCFALAQKANNLFVVDLDQALIDDVVSEIRKVLSDQKINGSVFGGAFNVRSETDMNKMARMTIEMFGRIDILVHCAGILRGKGRSPRFLHQISINEWDDVIDTNLKGTFLSNRAVLPIMIQQKKGHIINFSSTSGLKGHAFDSVYCATKFGVIGLSEAMAEEVRQYGIKVHVVLPDAVKTPIWEQNEPVKPPEDSLPPERVGELVCYLTTLPADTILGNLIITPFRTRRRKKEGS